MGRLGGVGTVIGRFTGGTDTLTGSGIGLGSGGTEGKEAGMVRLIGPIGEFGIEHSDLGAGRDELYEASSRLCLGRPHMPVGAIGSDQPIQARVGDRVVVDE